MHRPLRLSTAGDAETARQGSLATKRPWNVVVWDDPVTPMPVVVVIFMKVFGYPKEKATHLMLTVHNAGRAIVWSGARDRAETYCVRLHSLGLHASIEQDS
jgi:ATP-dependent Clp protease adaptor protein ClpS